MIKQLRPRRPTRRTTRNYTTTTTPARRPLSIPAGNLLQRTDRTEFAHGYTDRKLQYHFGLYGHEDEDQKAKLAKYLTVDLTSENNDTDKKQFEAKRKEHYKEETPYVEN